MLATLSDVMKIAEKCKIAIGAFNTPNLETLQAVIKGAEEEKLPVIIMFAQCHEALNPVEVMGPLMVSLAEKASVPVCVHLDHGETIDYVQKCLELGFTSVMYDGSVLPYEENVENTKKVVALAGVKGVSVEAELGSMGRRESGSGAHTGEEDETKIYTDPEQAKRFVDETGIDALACSFGTTHGIYLTEPRLDFDVVRKVRKLTDEIPVVMHGGSGVSKEDYRNAVKAGVRKINFFTYLDLAGSEAAGKYTRELENGAPLFYTDMISAAREAMKQKVRETIRTFALEEN